MKVLAIIFGILLVFPGVCFLGFGLMFSGQYETLGYGIIELVIGGLIMWGVYGLLSFGAKK